MNANITGGLATGPIRTLAIVPLTSLGRIRRPASRRTPRRRKSGRCWIPSETHAPSARRIERRARKLLLANQAFFDLLPYVADLLYRSLHGRRGAPGLLGLIAHFVLLTTGNPRPVLLPSTR